MLSLPDGLMNDIHSQLEIMLAAMTNNLVRFVMLVSLLCLRAKAIQETDCLKKAQTQQELNVCAAQRLATADTELNKVYRALLARVDKDVAKVGRIKRAQRAWLAYRDAEIEASFPESKRETRGSAAPMCKSMRLAELTTRRTQELQKLLEPAEGDVCYPDTAEWAYVPRRIGCQK